MCCCTRASRRGRSASCARWAARPSARRSTAACLSQDRPGDRGRRGGRARLRRRRAHAGGVGRLRAGPPARRAPAGRGDQDRRQPARADAGGGRHAALRRPRARHDPRAGRPHLRAHARPVRRRRALSRFAEAAGLAPASCPTPTTASCRPGSISTSRAGRENAARAAADRRRLLAGLPHRRDGADGFLARPSWPQLRPGIVYTSINCYGHEGPWRGRAGWEQLAQTVTGMAHVHGGAAGPKLQPGAVTDYTTGFLAAFGSLIALQRRALYGGSYLVRVSLCQTGMWVRSLGIAGEDRVAGAPEAGGRRDPRLHHREQRRLWADEPPAAGGPAQRARRRGGSGRWCKLGTHPAAWPARERALADA